MNSNRQYSSSFPRLSPRPLALIVRDCSSFLYHADHAKRIVVRSLNAHAGL